MVTGVAETLQTHQPTIFDEDLDELAQALAPARHTASRWWAFATNKRFRTAVALAGAQRRSKAGSPQLLIEVERARDQYRAWTQHTLTESKPMRPDGLNDITRSFIGVRDPLDALQRRFSSKELRRLPIRDLESWLNALAADRHTPFSLQRIHDITSELDTLGALRILQEIRARRPTPTLWPAVFEHALLSSTLEAIQAANPSLASFNGRTHDHIVEEFRRLDKERLKVAVDRVKRAHAERARQARNRFPDQDALVGREAEKKTRHLPLRQSRRAVC